MIFPDMIDKLVMPLIDSKKNKTTTMVEEIKNISEFNIGHFLIAESLFLVLKNTIKKFKKVRQEIKDLNAIIEDSQSDNEMKEMAKSELENLVSTEKELEKEIQIAVLPKDKDDSKNAVIEIRAGTGGDEAGLFAANLFRMYQRYCENNGWKFEILSISESLSGSYKEACDLVSGTYVFSKLNFESSRLVNLWDWDTICDESGRITVSFRYLTFTPGCFCINKEYLLQYLLSHGFLQDSRQ